MTSSKGLTQLSVDDAAPGPVHSPLTRRGGCDHENVRLSFVFTYADLLHALLLSRNGNTSLTNDRRTTDRLIGDVMTLYHCYTWCRAALPPASSASRVGGIRNDGVDSVRNVERVLVHVILLETC